VEESGRKAAANKRCGNIIRKAVEDGLTIPAEIVDSLLVEEGEISLAKAIAAIRGDVAGRSAAYDYTAALNLLAGIKSQVDNFFDTVMVMTNDSKQRDNRLALLNQLRGLFLQIADISHLQV